MPRQGAMQLSLSSFEGGALSAMSIATYTARLQRLCAATGKPLTDTVADAAASYKAMGRNELSTATRKNIVTAVASLLSHSPAFAKAHPAAVAVWKEGQKSLHMLVSARRDENVVTPEMRSKLVDISDARRVARALKAGGLKTLQESLDHLLLLLMTDVSPKRCDFGALRVFAAAPTGAADAGNYVVLPSRRDRTAVLVMHEYKTAKWHSAYREELPQSVAEALRASLAAFPREYVFVGRDGGKMTAQAYGEAVRSTFRRRMNKNAGVNALRHSYINYACTPGVQTTRELKATAHAMQHTLEEQVHYHTVVSPARRGRAASRGVR